MASIIILNLDGKIKRLLKKSAAPVARK